MIMDFFEMEDNAIRKGIPLINYFAKIDEININILGIFCYF